MLLNTLIMSLTLTLILTGTPHTQAAASELKVVNEAGQPIAGAQILIGDSLESPLFTDVNGTIAIPSKWAKAAPVTVTAIGYLTTTFLNLSPVEETLYLRRADSRNMLEAKGSTTRYPDLARDGKVDFSLVYPGFSRAQLTQLDIQSVISADIDVINVVSESVAVPSNLSVPTQRENYIIPITVDKPLYRMTFKQTGDYRMMATHGQFPIKQVVGDFRNGKSFFEVLNHFRFLSGGQRDVTINNDAFDQDIPVNQINYDSKITAHAPQFSDKFAMFSFSIIHQGGLYFPADVKRIYPGQTTDLAIPSQAEKSSLVNILTPLSEASKFGTVPPTPPGDSSALEPSPDDIIGGVKMLFTEMLNLVGNEIKPQDPALNVGIGGLSMAMTTPDEGVPVFLDLISRPTLNGNKLSVSTPQEVESIMPVTTKVVLSEVVHTRKSNYDIENVFKVWEAVQDGWSGEFELPITQFKITPGLQYRLEVIFMGRKISQQQNTEGNILNEVTHVTRNSVDFK